jgi:outer membrane protein assembly factor BamB
MRSVMRVVSKIVTIAPLFLTLAFAPITTLAQSQGSPADWTEFLRDNMQRWNPYETVLGVNNIGKVGLKWSSPYSLASDSPAVADGVVYFGSSDAKVYALDANTGAKVWSYGPGGAFVEPWSSPAVANGIVYIGSYNGKLYALDASTGAQLWSYTTGFVIQAPPAVGNGVVYVGSEDGNLYALNGTTGALVWSYPTGQITQGPAVLNGVVYVGASGPVYALNASTGAKLWSYDTGDSMVFSPAVANGVVYVGTLNFSTGSGSLYALNATTGAKLWSYLTGPIVSAPAVANGIVYVGNSSGGPEAPAPYIYAFNASTGALLWKYAHGGFGSSSPAVANGVVYCAGVALNASTGALLWQSNWGSSPVVVNGTLYAGAGNEFNAFSPGGAIADLFLRIRPTVESVHPGDSITYAFPVWNLGPGNADYEVLNTQVPEGTTFDHIRISGTPGLGTCSTPSFGGTGQIVCHENSAMAPNTTWTVRLTVRVTAPSGSVITESATTTEDTPDPDLANNTATVSIPAE